METIWQRIETWLAANAPQAIISLRAGASDTEIADAERRLGITLPDDVRSSYRIHDGQERDGYGPLPVEEFLSLERILDEWQVWKDLLDGGDFEGIESEPSGPIRSDWWNPRWIPLTYDGCG
ncbi:MAG: SMI1/KNR4 family protein, partial [Armatimonadota bacterium]|nr:SMI1/KNR4 family protein [Armatimonadota bacterium]